MASMFPLPAIAHRLVSPNDLNAGAAEFDDQDLCTRSGWATYHRRPRRPRWWRCWAGHHLYPGRPVLTMTEVDGPGAYQACLSCGVPVRWFVVGKHRFGGIGRWDR